MSAFLNIRDLGRLPYGDAWALQQELRRERIAGNIPNTFLFVEHPRVFTLGKRDCESDFLVPRELIEQAGIEIVKTDRGGRITYHGPGQIVGYFLFSLASLAMSVAEFVRNVEELCLRALADFGIIGVRHREHPGVWIGDKKIAAIGLHFSHEVSMHGFALNVDPQMEDYAYIIPCGIREKGVTSMAQVWGAVKPSSQQVKDCISCHLQELFCEFGVQKSSSASAGWKVKPDPCPL